MLNLAVIVALAASVTAQGGDVRPPTFAPENGDTATREPITRWTQDGTREPITRPPTQEPVTQDPATREPTTRWTQEPATRNTATREPITRWTQEPATREPITRPPTLEPETRDPATITRWTREPVTRDPATREPTTRWTQEPATRDTATREPITRWTQEPATREPITRPPTQEPETRDPATREPITREPITRWTREPETRDPATREPVTRETRTRPAGETRPIGDGNIRGDLPECKDLCTLESCRGSTLAECRTACNTKLTACQQAAAAALRQRVADSNSDFKQRVMDARADVADIDRLDGAGVKVRCENLCDERAGDRADACKTVCARAANAASTIETRREAYEDAAKVVIAAARARFNNAVKSNTDVNTQSVRDALDSLKDAVAQRRALFAQQRADLADKLDALIPKFKEARQERQDKLSAARALYKEYREKLDAATTDEERAAIRADGRAAVQKAIEDAKAAHEAARKRWASKIVKNVTEAHSDRRAARRVVVVELKNLKNTIENVRAGARDVDPSAEVAESTGERKRGTTVTVVVSCEEADESCGAALNNVISGAVDAESDATYTETTADEIDYESPVLEDDEKNVDEVTAGAPTLLVGAAATVYAMMIALF